MGWESVSGVSMVVATFRYGSSRSNGGDVERFLSDRGTGWSCESQSTGFNWFVESDEGFWFFWGGGVGWSEQQLLALSLGDLAVGTQYSTYCLSTPV